MTTTEKPMETGLEPDPFWDVPTGQRVEGDEYYQLRAGDDPYCGASSYGGTDFEGEGRASDRWSCSRGAHPSHWRHVALSGRLVVAKWGGDPTKQPLPVPDEVDAPQPDGFTPEIGGLYKAEGRRTLLMVVGFRRAGQVEILDLTHQRFRVLRRAQLRPKRDDMVPTPEQMRWAGQFMAERRKLTRDNALKQRRDGYFKSVTELNRVLAELGLEQHVRTRQGRVSIEIPVRLTSQLTDTALRDKFVEWITANGMPDGVALQEGRDFGRRNVYVDMSDI